MTMSLLELVKFASANVQVIFARTGVIYPMYHAIKSDGETAVFMAPMTGDKDFSVAMVKAAFALNNIERYVFIDEAWLLQSDSGLSDREIKDVAKHGVRNHPDRREIVMFSAESRDGEQLTARHYILRPEHGKPKLSPLKIDNMAEITSSMGRMVGLLKTEK